MSRPTCQWFALCDRDADGTLTHPVLGDVPTCRRCAERVEALDELRPFAYESGATYAALVREGGGWRQFGIVSGDAIPGMLANSDAPSRLRFELIGRQS